MVAIRSGAAALLVCSAVVFGSTSTAPAQAGLTTPLGTDLSVTTTAHATIPRTGGGGTISAVVANGPAAVTATGTAVVYVPPPGVAFDPAFGGAGTCRVDTGLIVCAIGTIAPGESVPFSIGVRTAGGDPGVAAGSFFPPRSDQWDPNAGELWYREWDVEADGQFESVTHCWPVDRVAPNMDIDGGGSGHHEACDGTVDREPPQPIADVGVERFPEPYKANVTRSWEWRTRVTPTTSGTYRICSSQIDDGGYIAMTPMGSPAGNGNIVLDVETFNVEREAVAELVGGTTYDVLIRIMNRGADGINNGGRFPGGWGYVGITPADATCDPSTADALGVNALAMTPRARADVELVTAASLEVSGAITSPADGWAEARVVNNGPDGDLIFVAAAGGAEITPIGLGPGEAMVVRTDLVGPGASTGDPRWSVSGATSLPPQP